MCREESDAQCLPLLCVAQMSFDPNLLHNNGHNGYPNGTSAALRETGVIEKLLTSYGFIQCSERQARLFFHCSQYNGNLQELKVGGTWALPPAPVSVTWHKIPSAASGAKPIHCCWREPFPALCAACGTNCCGKGKGAVLGQICLAEMEAVGEFTSRAPYFFLLN